MKKQPTKLTDAWKWIQSNAKTDPEISGTIMTIIRLFQLAHDLDMDGKPGKKTRAALAEYVDLALWPTPSISGLDPSISSKHADDNPSRPTHRGCDVMYRDPVRHRWFMPHAAACHAVLPGRVIRVEQRSNGWVVCVEHVDGYKSQHRHLAKPVVEVGDRVEKGEKLADYDVTQNPPHEHFERYGPNQIPWDDYDESLNPRDFLEAAMRWED